MRTLRGRLARSAPPPVPRTGMPPCQEACTISSVGRPPMLRELKRFASLAPRPKGSPTFGPAGGERIVLPSSTAIVAVGQETEGPAWAKALGLNGLRSDRDNRIGSGVYGAGDLVTGPATVVQAMAGGITCAKAILRETGR
jgi:NADPH-dependent glutamate synthase beta subunit-like oxidoreductase